MSQTACKPFGACLSEVLARHNLTAASVSRMLGHKSRTTLRRILQDQSNTESMEKFLGEFQAAQPHILTEADLNELHQSLEISRLGVSGYMAQQTLVRLLHGAPVNFSSLSIEVHDEQPVHSITSREFFESLSDALSLKILIINSISPVFFEAIANSLMTSDRIEIEHYFYLDHDIARTARFIASALPALSCARYTPYAIPPSIPLHSAHLAGSVLVCRANLADGTQREYQLGFASSRTGHLFSARSGIFDFWEGMLAPCKALALPVRLAVCASDDPLEYHLRRAETYERLEANRPLYILMPGLRPCIIPPDILSGAIWDGMKDIHIRSAIDPTDFHRRLTQTHARRFENILQKKRVTHIILSHSTMRSFVKTGMLAAPFYGMRPFTVRERREILIFCRNQTRENPYFNIYFLKNDALPICTAATCFESDGVLLNDPNARLTPNARYIDALITLPDFTDLYTRYFREDLIAHRVHSVSASISILSSLIDELPEENP